MKTLDNSSLDASNPRVVSNNAQLLGKRIRILRRTLEMSQKDLASKIGVTFQQLQKYESGQNRISVDRLYLISQALSVSIHYLLGSEDSSSSDSLSDLSIKDIMSLLKIDDERNLEYFVKIAKHLVRIESVAMKDKIVEFVEVMGS